jgi:choline monooxygenase
VARTLPGAWYADPDHHRREFERVFRRAWVGVGSDHDVAQPGSAMATTVAGVPVVVVRDTDGTLRAFLNVCRHRGAPLVEGCVRARALACPYHGWVYRLDGALARASGVGEPPEFDPDAFGLVPVRVTTFARSVLVNLDPDAPDFDPGPLAAGLVPYALDSLQFARRDRYECRFNWKVLLENYSENYHTPFVHAQLPVAGYEYPTECDGPLAFAWDRPLAPRDPSEQALLDFGPRDPGWAAVATHPAAESFYNGAYVTIWPNTMLSMFAGFAATFRLTPLSPTTTLVERDYLWAADVDDARRARDYEATAAVVRQDLEICEALQRTYDGGCSADGVLSTEHERAVEHMHGLLKAALASDDAG